MLVTVTLTLDAHVLQVSRCAVVHSIQQKLPGVCVFVRIKRAFSLDFNEQRTVNSEDRMSLTLLVLTMISSRELSAISIRSSQALNVASCLKAGKL